MANLPYIQALDTTTQVITTADTPQPIILNTIDDINEFSLDASTGIITYDKEGAARKFTYIVAPQVTRDGDCEDEVPNFRCWIQKKADGEAMFADVPNANVLLNVNRHRLTKDVILLTGLITLEKDNEIRFMMASNVDGLVKIEAIPFVGESDVPSVIVSVFNIGLEKDE